MSFIKGKKVTVLHAPLLDWLWLVADADLLLKKNAAGWCWFGVREKYYWLVVAEQSDIISTESW